MNYDFVSVPGCLYNYMPDFLINNLNYAIIYCLTQHNDVYIYISIYILYVYIE